MSAALFAPIHFTNKTSNTSVGTFTSDALVTVTGNFLLALVTMDTNSFGSTPLSDSKSNTWHLAGSVRGSGSGFVGIYYAENITGGSGHTVTVTPTTGAFIGLFVSEYSGIALSSSLSNTDGGSSNATTHTTPSITAGASFPELFVGVGCVNHVAENTPVLNKTNWFQLAAFADGSVMGGIAAFRFVPAGTSDTFSYTVSSAFDEGYAIAGFKAASSGLGGGGSATFVG